MGVTYKLRDEVVNFIVSQRQEDPLVSCRQLAQWASQKFDLNLSKSSVSDVLKASGIQTPKGRKPKDKFEIPQEKKKQIQQSLSGHAVILSAAKDLKMPLDYSASPPVVEEQKLLANDNIYEGAGRIFLKAALWDLGIFTEEKIKEEDWYYFLTYSKGIKVTLENSKDLFIDLPLPIERCIREVADGLINNVRPLVVHKVSDEALFKACMDAQIGDRIKNVSIVDYLDHILLNLDVIMEQKRQFIFKDRIFVENSLNESFERTKTIFFTQLIDNEEVIKNILKFKGFDTIGENENIVTLLIDNSYDNKIVLQQAADKLNGMYIRDDQGRLVKVEIKSPLGPITSF